MGEPAAAMDGQDLFSAVDAYIDGLFAAEDAALKGALEAARRAGAPDIQVSAGQGKLLYLLARLAGARRILEVGTLAGYSAIWLARALEPGGRLVSLELSPDLAALARRNLQAAGLADRTQVVVGPAAETLPQLIAAADAPFDLVFLDADKASFPLYLDLVLTCVRPGSLILADNVVRKGAVLAPAPDDASAQGAKTFNARLAAEPRVEAIVLQQVGVKGHDGLALARVR